MEKNKGICVSVILGVVYGVSKNGKGMRIQIGNQLRENLIYLTKY